MTEAFMPLQRNRFDPVPELGQRRSEQPVSKLEFPFGISAWLVTRYADVKQVLGSVDGFSNDFRRLTAAAGAGDDDTTVDPGGLGFADPPDHTRLRRLLTPQFTVRRLAQLGPGIEKIITGRLDAMEQAGPPVDLVAEFAMPIPSLVICELLGVPYEDRETFQSLSESRFDLFGNLGDPMGAITASLQYLTGLVEQQRRDPGDGLLGMLIREHGDEITDAELAGLADGLLTGGHETTASSLALGALVLMERPDLAASLRDSDTDTAAVVEELLRYLTVVQVAFPRFARTDLEIGGQRIAAGDMVLCSLSAADRDSELVGRPDEVAPDQAVTAHLAFGYGIHRCVGAELARIELRAAFPALVRRFPGLAVAGSAADLTFREYSLVHGMDALPVTW
ncbi:cytochrome P450 [Nakamurella flavida]|uniref:Cytochrome P450 n=1 Tax=Nakamurella flavida TaxID=363630 RepID=A0A939C2G1_9ACTN|nr:cytochrome P450 [Nakamurella flavida]MBM9476535.1 cytochrome P450 [Nakamurella flavida]MDP9779027.1 cytochrome P450 [Nakamurella flavida]